MSRFVDDHLEPLRQGLGHDVQNFRLERHSKTSPTATKGGRVQFDLENSTGGTVSDAATRKILMPDYDVDLADLTGDAVIDLYNDSGGALAIGDLVSPNGYDATSGKISVQKSAAEALALGTLEVLICAEASVVGETFRAVRRLVLTGVNTSGGAIGGPLYLSSTAGQWTVTIPTHPAYRRVVGTCILDHASTGIVLLHPNPVLNRYLDEITTVSMADATHTLTLTTAGANETRLLGYFVRADAQSSSPYLGEVLILPAESLCAGYRVSVLNIGQEPISIRDDGGGYVCLVRSGASAVLSCDGTSWMGVASNPTAAATVVLTGGTGGATAGTLTIDLKYPDTSTVFAHCRILTVYVRATGGGGTAGNPALTLNGTTTFSSATKGSIISANTGWALVSTDDNGEFDCTISNSADESVYAGCLAPTGGAALTAFGGAIGPIVSDEDDGTWSA